MGKVLEFRRNSETPQIVVTHNARVPLIENFEERVKATTLALSRINALLRELKEMAHEDYNPHEHKTGKFEPR